MHTSTRSSKRIGFTTITCAVVLLALPWIVFWPEAIGRQVWSGGDISGYNFPLMVGASEQWREGQLPLWNPYLTGGTPFAAHQQSGIFYPLNILQWLVEPAWLMLSHSILLHLSLAGISIFLLLLSLDTDPLAALLGGITFQFSGYAMSHLGHMPVLRALPWPGFILWGINRWIRTRQSKYLACIGLASALLTTSGYPQVVAYSFLLVFSYPLFMSILCDKAERRAFLSSFLAMALGIGLAAIQLFLTIPMWLTGEYLRAGEGLYSAFVSMSFHPAYLVTLLFPTARSGTYAEMVGYIGIVSLILAVLALWTILYRKADRRQWFFALWAVLGLLLAFGGFIPPIARLSFKIPTYNGFAVLSKHLLEFTLSMAVLAGLGMDILLCKSVRLNIKALAWKKIAVFLVFGGMVIYLALISPFSEDTPPLRLNLPSRQIWQPLLLLLVSCALLWGVGRVNRRARYALFLGMIVVLTFDLVDFGASIYRSGLTSPSSYQDLPVTATVLRQDSAEWGPFRTIAFRAQGNSMAVGKMLLGANYTMAYGIESVIGHDGLMLRAVNAATSGAIPPWGYVDPEAVKQPQFRRLLDLWGVRYLLTVAKGAPILSQYYAPFASVGDVIIFKSRGARARLFPLVPKDEVITSSIVQSFGESLTLTGYGLGQVQKMDDGTVSVPLYTRWSCQHPLTKDYTLFIHYVNDAGNVLAQGDHRLGGRSESGTLPTTQWSCPGEYEDMALVPGDLIKGNRLEVAFGLWIPESGERLASQGVLPVDQAAKTHLDIKQVETRKSTGDPVATDSLGRAWFDPCDSCGDVQSVRLVHYRGDRISADVSFGRDGALIHGTNYASGWKAAVDGVPTRIFRVEGLLQGIQVPQGQHRVEFWYAPDTFEWAATTSAISLGLLLAFVFWLRKKHPSSH
jgi:hypothetical protein